MKGYLMTAVTSSISVGHPESIATHLTKLCVVRVAGR